jgi:RNA polymerase sigma-70 factor (ECF subfamily)
MADGSFEEFYDATYHRLLRQLVLVTGDRGDAEDLLQDAYGRAAVRWRRLGDYQAPEAWVRRVALRLATDRARRARRRAAALLRLGPPPHPPSVELSADLLDLYTALRELPAGQRQAVVLHHLVGLPVEEVARQLNLPVGTIKSRLTRGRAVLARCLEPGREVVRHDR